MPKRAKDPADRGLELRRTPEGTKAWYARLLWFGQDRRFGPFASKTEARNEYGRRKAELRDLRLRPGEVKPTTATVDHTYRHDYLPSVQGRVSGYKNLTRYAEFWCARFKGRPWLSLAPSDVELAMADLRRTRLDQHPGGRRPATVNQYVQNLRYVMRKYVRPRAWVLDFWAAVTLDDPTKGRTPPTILTIEQEERLYQALDPDDALAVRLAVLTGLRLSHFFALRWDWVRWESQVLDISAFKRREARSLPLPLEAVAILAVLWEAQGRPEHGWVFPIRKQTYRGAGRGRWTKGPVIRMPTGHLNGHNWYNRRYAPAVKAAGLAPLKVTFHTLRRTWASRIGSRAPGRILQILGGWSSLKQVEIYCHPHDTATRMAMEQGAQAARPANLAKIWQPTLDPDAENATTH